MEWLKQHLTYANVMATIAVFGVLGGGAYAAGVAPKNSVTSKSVKDNSLTGQDVNESTLQGIQGSPGPQGLQGIQGIQGVQGVPGPTAAGVANRGDPVATPDSINPTGSGLVSAPTSGRILAMASGTVTANCTAGNPTLGLFLEGTTPIPDTLINLANGATTVFSTFGLTGTVAPGSHAIVFVLDCPSGTFSPTPTIASGGQLGGILIGQ